MHSATIPHFSLQRTADCGQCFRMLPLEEGRFSLVTAGRPLTVGPLGDDRFLFDSSRREYEGFWRQYFDLDTDYEAFYAEVDAQDAFLRRAVSYARGLRILRQDPFEALISFILSQRKNIPAIHRAVACLCERFGEELHHRGQSFRAFPSPRALAEAGEEALRLCSLGYRAPYVYRTSLAVATGAVDLEALKDAGDEELRKALLSLPGVGEKVAECVMLFGFHRLNAFPVDVWIGRVIQREYGGRFPLERYPGFAGVMQQCLFLYARDGCPSFGKE